MDNYKKLTEEVLVHKAFGVMFDKCEILGQYIERLSVLGEGRATKLCKNLVQKVCSSTRDWAYLEAFIYGVESMLEHKIKDCSYITEFDICAYLGIDVPSFAKRKTLLLCEETSPVKKNQNFEVVFICK